MEKRLERILPRVQKPARYVGGEYNQVVKDKAQVDVRFAFCFPDTYEIGMSNLGMRILYGVMNNIDGVWCERVFAPWPDMEEELRRAQIPLYALESGDAVREFDILGFSLGYEMAFSNVLNVLDLAGIPLHASERTALTPLIMAGGTACFNAEPLAEFIDLFSLGEGEDVTVEIIELYRRAKRGGGTSPASCVRRHGSKACMSPACTTFPTMPTALSPRLRPETARRRWLPSGLCRTWTKLIFRPKRLCLPRRSSTTV